MKTCLSGVYDIVRSSEASSSPLVFDSPHSGHIYPEDFHYACDFAELQKAEDTRVNELFEPAALASGGILLKALFPRSYIDVNRGEDDLDPELIADLPMGTILPGDGRSPAGHGLIRRLLKPNGGLVYNRPLYMNEVRKRITDYYRPYHTALAGLVESTHAQFGKVFHISIHSMPASVAAKGPFSLPTDFALADLDGTSCDLGFRRRVQDRLRDLGYRVSVNTPYRGHEILRRYGNPAAGIHSLQIEINKALYLDEETGKNRKNINDIIENIQKITSVALHD
jgi:N-formylglutamate deformylase